MEHILFKKSCLSPSGLAYDGTSLWITDEETKMLYRLDSNTGEVTFSRQIPSKITAMCWGMSKLWMLDNLEKAIICYDPAKDEICETIHLDLSDYLKPVDVHGLAFDGEYFWYSVEAGWSSRYYRLDKSGTQVFIFSECNPDKLACDSEYLWGICYNMGVHPCQVSRRVINDDLSTMHRSRENVYTLNELDRLSGLTVKQDNLLLIDQKSNAVIRVEGLK